MPIEAVGADVNEARQAATMWEQYELLGRIRALEAKKPRSCQRIFDFEDEITAKCDKHIDALEKHIQQRTSPERFFTIGWKVI